MNLRPLQDRVIIERVESQSKTAGGFIIPDTAQQKAHEGSVLAIGKDVKDVAVGDKILLNKWAGAEIKHEGKELLIVKESDIIAIV